jgi:hypothetical protein
MFIGLKPIDTNDVIWRAMARLGVSRSLPCAKVVRKDVILRKLINEG